MTPPYISNMGSNKRESIKPQEFRIRESNKPAKGAVHEMYRRKAMTN